MSTAARTTPAYPQLRDLVVATNRVLGLSYGPLALLSISYFGASVIAGFVPFGGVLLIGTAPFIAGAALGCARAFRSGTFDHRDIFEPFASLGWLEVILVSVLVGIPAIFGTALMLMGVFAIRMGLHGSSATAQAVGLGMGGALLLVSVLFLAWVQARLLFAHVACLDRAPGFDAITPIRRSWELTSDRQWSLVGLVVLTYLVALLGMALLCVGFVAWSFPWIIAATGAAYGTIAAPGMLRPEDDLSRCPACRYDMSSLPGDTCPECGLVHRGRARAQLGALAPPTSGQA